MKLRKLISQLRWVGFLFFVASAVLLVLSNQVVFLGRNIPQDNLIEDYTFGFFWAIFLGVALLFLPLPRSEKWAIFDIWLFKCIITLVFMLFYEYNYSSLDAYSYFAAPQQSTFSWIGFQLGRGTRNILQLVWLCYQVMPTSYHGLKVSFAPIGLAAIYLLYRSTAMYLGYKDLRILYLLGFFPSIVFWSSIVGKDPIVLLGISVYIYGVVGWGRLHKLKYIPIAAIGLLLAMFIRIWLGLIFTLPIPILILSRRGGGNLGKKATLTAVMVISILLSFSVVQSYFNIADSQELLEFTDTTSKSWSHGGSGQEIQGDLTQSNQTLALLPLAMFTALFRPLPGEILNPFGLMAGLENALLLLLLGRAVYRNRSKDLKDPLIQWAILLVVFWAGAYGFISYQNLGTAVRFKLQVLPILLCLLLYLGRKQKLNRR